MLGVGSWAGCVARLIWCDAPSDVVKVLVVAEAEFVSTSHIDLLVAPVRSVEVVDEYGALAVALISTQWRCQSFTSFPCRRWTTCTRHNRQHVHVHVHVHARNHGAGIIGRDRTASESAGIFAEPGVPTPRSSSSSGCRKYSKELVTSPSASVSSHTPSMLKSPVRHITRRHNEYRYFLPV